MKKDHHQDIDMMPIYHPALGVTIIDLMQCNTSPLHGVAQVVDCGLWNVGSLLFKGCQGCRILAGIGTRVIHTDSEHPRHAQQVTCLVSMQTMQELGHLQFSGIVCSFLHYRAMLVDEWYNDGPQDLVTESLCIQISINKINEPVLLSIAYACPYKPYRHHAALCSQR